jgi:hypothetical protein
MKDFRDTEKEIDGLIEAKWRLELLRKQAERMKKNNIKGRKYNIKVLT